MWTRFRGLLLYRWILVCKFTVSTLPFPLLSVWQRVKSWQLKSSMLCFSRALRITWGVWSWLVSWGQKKRGQKVTHQKAVVWLGNGALCSRPHQYALVDVSVADALHTDPDDAWVINLLVVDGQRGRRRAAGRWLFGGWGWFRVLNRRSAEVRVWGAARGAGESRTGGGHRGEVFSNIVQRAWERLWSDENLS